nr:MAG TPA: hypothetical protein [Caudoviricetes sp.]
MPARGCAIGRMPLRREGARAKRRNGGISPACYSPMAKPDEYARWGLFRGR